MSHCCSLYKMTDSIPPDIDWLTGEYQFTAYYNIDTCSEATFYVCYEDQYGMLFVANDKYRPAQVNFYPFCGYKAPVQIIPLLETILYRTQNK